MKYVPNFDKSFKPAYREVTEFLKKATKPFSVCVERNNGYVYRYDMKITDNFEESYDVVERIVKSILWIVGGYKIYVAGSKEIYEKLKCAYECENGARKFDSDFMARVYESKFEVIYREFDALPEKNEVSVPVGGNTKGCRIGFDAGGSDRKVSAVIDGVPVYSEEVVWFPKTNSDPSYHYDGILTAMKTAASHMPRVDAIGVSSAGVYINNRIMVASLFIKVSDEDFEKKVKNMYLDVAKEIGAPVVVANDGDVTALAGAMELNDNNVLGIAMGTSEAAGYINSEGCLMGWLNELAFVPCDFNKDAMVDEWSGDYGCGVKYFSQDSVIKLAEYAGLKVEGNSPAEKLKFVQNLNAEGNEIATKIFEDIGIYLGNTIAYYSLFYDIKHLLLLGRVTSGKGGESIMEYARKVLAEEYPELNVSISMPDEKNRRVGQSVAAASL